MMRLPFVRRDPSSRLALCWVVALLALGGAAVVPALSACDGPVNPNCTLRDCFSGLKFELGDNVPPAFVLTVWDAENPDRRRVVECSDSEGPCSAGFGFIYLEEFTPERIGVSVNGQILTQDFRPPYEKVFPNGEHCPGMCRVATMVLDFG